MNKNVTYIYRENKHGKITKKVCALKQEASPDVAQMVLSKPVDNDGRSEFFWLRLQNGDLVLGVYPRGDTYCATEHDRSV